MRKWVSKDNIGDYMSRHRYDTNINELKTYFNGVIDWVSTVFLDVESEMKGLEWGRLYETYKKQPYNPKDVSAKVKELYADMLKPAKAFLNTFSAVRQIPNCSTCACLTKRPKKPFIQNKPPKPRKKANQIVRSARWDTMPTKRKSGNSPKWMPTTSPRGAKAAQQT